MAGIVRLFGWLAAIFGAVVAVVTFVATPTVNPLGAIIGVVYFLGGLLMLALCSTVADTSDRTAAILEHLRREGRGAR